MSGPAAAPLSRLDLEAVVGPRVVRGGDHHAAGVRPARRPRSETIWVGTGAAADGDPDVVRQQHLGRGLGEVLAREAPVVADRPRPWPASPGRRRSRRLPGHSGARSRRCTRRRCAPASRPCRTRSAAAVRFRRGGSQVLGLLCLAEPLDDRAGRLAPGRWRTRGRRPACRRRSSRTGRRHHQPAARGMHENIVRVDVERFDRRRPSVGRRARAPELGAQRGPAAQVAPADVSRYDLDLAGERCRLEQRVVDR